VVKFLSGGQRDGERIPLCTYWRNDLTTDTSEDVAVLEGTGEEFPQLGKGQDSAIGDFSGQCIANAFFNREDITCFNDGDCDGEGKCLPCSKYTYGGMRMAISHSPPIEILKNFDKGLTDIDLLSPNLVRFPPSAINQVDQDQLPYHILIRNIQAVIDKCCHWNVGDGLPSEFFLAPIITGPENKRVLDVNGNPANLDGIIVTHPEFPDTVGTFFPVGTVVVAGFKDQPSFYLEPRTGLFKPGDGVIFKTNVNSPSSEARTLAISSSAVVFDTVNAANFSFTTAANLALIDQNFLDNATFTANADVIEAAQAKSDASTAKAEAAEAAAEASQTLGQEANDLVGEVLAATVSDDIFAASKDLADTLDELAEQAVISSINAGADDASAYSATAAGQLRRLARQLRFSAFGAETKCEFAFEDNNVAKQWNLPEDGTLPCNGVRTDCDFYTGAKWLFATDEKMELGQPITGDQLQEVRARSDDFVRFPDPAKEFESRFSTPFIWAFKEYRDVFSTPRIEDMELYRPKLLFGRGTPGVEWETILMDKITVTNFEDFAVSKEQSKIQPGSPSLDLGFPPQFPLVITQPVVPSNVRLKITHPRRDDLPFIYRTWSPAKNKISLFGTGSADAAIFIVNNTALQNRNRYHNFLGTRNFTEIVSSLPDTPTFNNTFAFDLRQIFQDLEEEQSLNTSAAPLGFARVGITREGAWQSIRQIDLVHNQINEIFVFLLIDDLRFIFDSTKIDYRFLHAVMAQTKFEATDFTINDTAGSSQMGSSVQNVVDGAIIEAEMRQTAGTEAVSIAQAYYGLRFKSRNLRQSTLTVVQDLEVQERIGALVDDGFNLVPIESEASNLITRVGYKVVQYRKVITVKDWYVIDNCGNIMLRIEDLDLHRVLPLPDQSGTQKRLTNVLVNGGVKGTVEAQWALEKVTLKFRGESKDLGQVIRDADGIGLPANYVVVGPKADSNEVNAFGRPEIGEDSITIEVTFLASQTAGLASLDSEPAPAELDEEVVEDNFNFDNLLISTNISEGTGTSFTAGSTSRPDDIERDQQDYVFIFKDSDGRPIGRKITRFMVLYYGLSVVAVEIVYAWRGSCTTYALFPDFNLELGSDSGQLSQQPKGVTDADDLFLQGPFSVKQNSLGTKPPCLSAPSCGDHDFRNIGVIQIEFNTIVISEEFPQGKAFFPSAGQQVPVGLSSISSRPGEVFLKRQGPLWYPYDACEQSRYDFKTGGSVTYRLY